MRQIIIFTCLILLLICAACSSTGAAKDDSLPVGDADSGAALFAQSIGGAPACSTCHTLDTSTLVGPGMKGLSTIASTRIAGTSAAEYIHDSISRPASYIVDGFGNLMYNQYTQRLTPQQMADLIAYLLTL